MLIKFKKNKVTLKSWLFAVLIVAGIIAGAGGYALLRPDNKPVPVSVSAPADSSDADSAAQFKSLLDEYNKDVKTYNSLAMSWNALAPKWDTIREPGTTGPFPTVGYFTCIESYRTGLTTFAYQVTDTCPQ